MWNRSVSIVIAKNNNVKITAVDINENAIKYLNENIRLNKLHNIKSICGDIREVSKNLNKNYDRIIMNLPGLAYDFFRFGYDPNSKQWNYKLL